MSELHVLCKVAAAEYVLRAADVLQMESFEGATKVPGAPAHVAGLAQIRGRVVPVIDMRVLFGLPPIERTIDSRIVVLKHVDRVVGLLVDSAREVIKIAPETFQPPPPVVAQQTDGLVRAVAQVGERLLMLIDPTKVMGEEHEHAG